MSGDGYFLNLDVLADLTKTINQVKYIIHYAAQFDVACRSLNQQRFANEAMRLLDDTCPPKLLWVLLQHFIRRPTCQDNLVSAFRVFVGNSEVQRKIGRSILEEVIELTNKEELTYNDEKICRAVRPIITQDLLSTFDEDLSPDDIDRTLTGNRARNVQRHYILDGGDAIESICDAIRKDKVNQLRRMIDTHRLNPTDKLDLVGILECDIFSATSFLDIAAFYGSADCFDYLRSQVELTNVVEGDIYRHMILGRQTEMMSKMMINWDDTVIAGRITETILEMDDPVFFDFYLYKRFEHDPGELMRQIVSHDAILCLDIMRKHPAFLWQTYTILSRQRGGVLVECYLSGTRKWFHERVQDLQDICDNAGNMSDEELERFEDEIKKKAHEIGFEIARHPEGGRRGMYYYCKYGAQARTGNGQKRTQKCDCHFHIRLYKGRDGWHITGRDLDHTPHYMQTQLQEMSIEAKHIITAMRRCKLSPTTVSKIMNLSIGSSLTVSEVDAIAEETADERGFDEFEELTEKVQTEGGIVQEFVQFGKRIALFVMRRREIEMVAYSDVLFVDATHYPNRHGWSYIPVSVLNADLQIRTLAELYTSSQDQSVYTFLFEQLHQIEEIAATLKTIITDEDSAFLAAFPQIQAIFEGRWLTHIICAWHKGNRVRMKIDHSDLSPEKKEKLKQLVHIICYSRCTERAEAALVEFVGIAEEDETLRDYVRDHVVALRDKFAVAWLPDCFNLGYNTSSVAESNNARSKRGFTASQYTVLELSESVAAAEASSEREQQFRDRLRQHNSLSLRCGVQCQELIQKKIEGSLKKAFRLIVNRNGPRYIFTDPLHEGEEFVVSGGACNCRKLEMTGLPCSHLLWVEMRKYQEGESPTIFKPEWQMDRLHYRLVDPTITPQELERLLHKPVNPGETAHQPQIDATQLQVADQRVARTENPAQRRFRKLTYLANPMIAKASMYEEMTDVVMQVLTALAERVIRETANMPIQDQGRPRIRRFPGAGG